MAIEYLANVFWQLPLLAAGAWLLLRMWRPGPTTQHRVWLAVLFLALLLPLRGIAPAFVNSALDHDASATILNPISPDALPATVAAGISAIGNMEEHRDATSPLHRIRLNATAVNWILGLWLTSALAGLFRLLLAWTAARRLARSSREAVLASRETAALLKCANRLGIKIPRVHESAHISGPVVVGVARPVLLWPRHFALRSDDELTAALCHEMAHIRRRDYAVNLLCEAASLPLKWHPAIYPVERRIRATREMACDAMAARAMQSETAYAACLVSLARSIAGVRAERSLAAGLFNGNVMEERVMRLVQNRTTMNWRMRLVRAAAGAAAMTSAIALASTFYVVPAMAQATPPPPPPMRAAPAVPPVAAAPATPANPAAPVVQSPQIPPAPQQPTPPAEPARDSRAQPHAHHSQARSRNPDKPIIFCDDLHKLTPAERARIEAQLAQAQKQIAAATAQINSPEFRRQIEEAQRKALQAETMLNSAQFKQQVADAQKQVAAEMAKLNSPEFKKQMAEAQKQVFAVTKLSKQQMALAQKQIAEATAKINSPEFRRQIEEAAKAASAVNTAEIQKQMADAQKQLADALAQMKAEQKSTSSQKAPVPSHSLERP